MGYFLHFSAYYIMSLIVEIKTLYDVCHRSVVEINYRDFQNSYKYNTIAVGTMPGYFSYLVKFHTLCEPRSLQS